MAVLNSLCPSLNCRVPYHMQELLLKLRSTKVKFQEEHNRPPTDEEVAALLKVCVWGVLSACPSLRCHTWQAGTYV